MELKPGYKQTEIGVIPEDWEVKSLGKFLALQRGHDLTERDRRRGDIPVIGSAGPNGFHDTAIVRGPGVVLGRSGASFGQAHYCTSDFWPHNTALYVTDFFGNNRLFAFYCVKSINFSRHNSGGAQQSLNRNFIAPIPIGVPHLPEQEAIAGALSDADALIESLEHLIVKKRHIKQGAMQELLTGNKRLPGFSGSTTRSKETEVGPIPEDWVVAKLGDSLSERPAYGINAPAVQYQDNLPRYIRITDITDDGRFLTGKPVSVNATNTDDYFLEDGDLVFARTGASVGKSYRYMPADGRLVFAGFLIRVRPNPSRLIPSFLAAFATTGRYWNWVRLMSMRSGQPGINGIEYAQMPIPCPTVDEQTAIAAILSDMDAEIAALEAKLAKARQIKQGMMHNLLTGKIRLV